MSARFSAEGHVRALFSESARLKTVLAEEAPRFCSEAAGQLVACFEAGGKALLLGNGGSAADAQHIAAEWTGRLLADRPALPALALTANTSDLTAISNDYGFDRVFSRLVEAHGREGDALIAISTSGNSPNVILAVEEARRRGLRTIGLTGKDGGKLAAAADLAFVVPSEHTGRIQECHIALLHAICEVVDLTMFPELRP